MTHIKASIIIITLNGATRIEKSIEALLKQSYPKENYEIIVVDDGSTDNTAQIVKNYPVTLLTHERNKGRPAARNTGWKNAQGDIIAYIDDDCIPEENWLQEIIESYTDESIIGVGGTTKPFQVKTLAELYQYETGYGNPASIEFNRGNNIAARFFVYIKNLFLPPIPQQKITEVLEIYTGNASYKKEYIAQINGFDESLKTSEDSDLSIRLKKQFPDKKLLWNTHAITKNQYTSELIKIIEQTWKRSANTLTYFQKHNKIPTVFPIPILLCVLLILGFTIGVNFGILLLLLPPLLYPWWIMRSITKKNIRLLSCIYLQPLLETIHILGYLRVLAKKSK